MMLFLFRFHLDCSTVDFRFKQDVMFQTHLIRELQIFPFSFTIHKILLKAKPFNLSKENSTCLNRKITVQETPGAVIR